MSAFVRTLIESLTDLAVVRTDTDATLDPAHAVVVATAPCAITLPPNPEFGESHRIVVGAGPVNLIGGAFPLSIKVPTPLPTGVVVDLSFDGEKWDSSEVSNGGAPWTNVPAWYIDPINGNDANQGTTPATAIKTWAQLHERQGNYNKLTGGPVGGPLPAVVVNLLSTSPPTDPAILRAFLTNHTMLVLTGPSTTVLSGTITAVTTLNRTTGQAWEITSAAPLVVGQRGRVVGGPNDGQIFRVLKDLGAGVFRISAPSDPDLSVAFAFSIFPTPGAVSPGDAFVVESIPGFTWGDIDIRGDLVNPAPYVVLSIVNLDILGDTGAPGNAFANVQTGDTRVVIKGGAFDQAVLGGIGGGIANYAVNCYFKAGLRPARADWVCLGGAAEVSGQNQMASELGGALTVDLDFAAQCDGTNFVPGIGNNGGQLTIGNASAYDSGVMGVQIGSGFINAVPNSGAWLVPVFDFTATLYGTGNVGEGLRVASGCSGLWDWFFGGATLPTITGAGGDLTLGGASTARAWDEAAGVYGPALALSWANLAAAPPGGFGGSAHNVQQDSHFIHSADVQ